MDLLLEYARRMKDRATTTAMRKYVVYVRQSKHGMPHLLAVLPLCFVFSEIFPIHVLVY